MKVVKGFKVNRLKVERPRYANNFQPWPKGHATRTTLAKRPRYANNLGQKATLREQPSTH
ncbi:MULTISPECIES: hypothetical protein [unclassified Moorena]|uniref:hypothetical protein n=1 Tax=unclassified Moorena TaxID=2683338 RepID=UPI0013CCBB27|nr:MULTISPECIES: hypothetical protein [unclassified Moorena]NEO20144.1 hypothetical protein [Moorena sp. SIO4A5]NEQ59407.1 hypothetical protein [Moorena sp. SIO4A1]